MHRKSLEKKFTELRSPDDQNKSLKYHSTEGQKALLKPNALFSSEQGNMIRSSVFRNATPSILREYVLEGNKDHLFNQARSDLAKQELHVESLNKCIGHLQNERRSKTGHHTTYTTDLLYLHDNKFDYKQNCIWKKKFSEILKSEMCTKWEKLTERKNNELTKSQCKRVRENHETIQKLTSQLQEMQEQMNSMNDSGDYKMWNRITAEDCFTFPVNLWWFRVLALCSAATEDCRLTHGINLDYRKTLLEINFLRLIHPEIILKEFNLSTCKKPRSSPWSREDEDYSHKWRHICNKAVDYEFYNAGGITAEFCGRTADRIGSVRPGESSDENRTWLSQIEDYDEKKYRARNSK